MHGLTPFVYFCSTGERSKGVIMIQYFGYLVVRVNSEPLTRKSYTNNPHYKGVALIPPYPSDDIFEQEPLDRYVFGDFKDKDTNLIPSYERAKTLCTWLNELSKKYLYEIVLCCDSFENLKGHNLPMGCTESRGYDIATIRGDYWSIVEDMPADPWTTQYKVLLNQNGLFTDRAEAVNYLSEYKERGAPDCDMPLDIIYIAKVLDK